jgi:hypothetical protein
MVGTIMDNTTTMMRNEPLPPRLAVHRRRSCRERPVHRRTIRSCPSQQQHPNHPPTRTHDPTTSPDQRTRVPMAPANMIQRVSTLQVPTTLSKLSIGQTAVPILVDYLVYTRGLFPLTVAELSEQHTECTTPTMGLPYSTSSRTMQRKLKSAYDQRTKFMEAWNSASTSGLLQQSSCALITIGPSYGRGVESYLLDLRELQTQSSPATTPPPPNVLARKLLSKIVEAHLSLPRSNSASFRLFVSLLVKSQEGQAQMKGSETFSTLGSVLDMDSPHHCWIPRSGRVLPALQEMRPKAVGRSPKQQLVVISLRHGPGSNDDQHGISMESMSDDDILDTFHSLSAVDRGQWFCHSQAIRGFRV